MAKDYLKANTEAKNSGPKRKPNTLLFTSKHNCKLHQYRPIHPPDKT